MGIETTNSVSRFIDFIKVLTDDEYETLFQHFSSRQFYKGVGCYELVKILQHFLSDIQDNKVSQIFVSNDFTQCAFFYRGILYDIDGIVEDIDGFHMATPIDLEYLSDNVFGRIEMKFDGVKPSIAIIRNIMQCRIDSLIYECRNIEDNPDFYKQLQMRKTREK